MKEDELKIFEDKKIRAKWDDKKEKWFFSIVDIVAALTESDYQRARNYWKVLKSRLKDDGGQRL